MVKKVAWWHGKESEWHGNVGISQRPVNSMRKRDGAGKTRKGEWHGKGRMAWKRENGMGKREWHGKGRMAWGRENGMEKGEWHGKGRMAWDRENGMVQREWVENRGVLVSLRGARVWAEGQAKD
ncbi:hypothetical protein KC19_12G097000 [Ceratodon purpureus]|uniref:Uncharacterized protein n=1 Tax=Ceratodon purpureus TaxID=3225 RepID=A0A8T0G832_CERPU|nr:hypothetical protein KC19_12G097000 [Ceratodon purpureus]